MHVGWGGTTEEAGAGSPITRDSIFRISSMTKPVTAVAVLQLVEDCVLRLDDPIDTFLPELADRRVLRDPSGPLDDTVPANRPISVRDVLDVPARARGWTWSTGTARSRCSSGAAELGLGAGPPAPQLAPPTDEWLRRLAELPLSYQPGERWLYNIGSDVAGALVERAAGRPFADVLRERIFEPLAMVDTGFHVPAEKLDRFGPVSIADPATGAIGTYDGVRRAVEHAAGVRRWCAPAWCRRSTTTWRSPRMLLAGGTADGHRILSPATVAAMVTAHVESGPDPDGSLGWGFGLGRPHGASSGIAQAPGRTAGTAGSGRPGRTIRSTGSPACC